MESMAEDNERHLTPKQERHAAMGRGVLDVTGAARFLGVSSTTIYKLARAGEIPARRVGKEWRFSHARLTKWLEEESVPDADHLARLLQQAKAPRKL